MGKYASWVALHLRKRDVPRFLAGKVVRRLVRFFSMGKQGRTHRPAPGASSSGWHERSAFLEPALEHRRHNHVAHLPVRPKIVHLIGSLQPGGAERQLCNFVIGAHRRGYDVSVILIFEPVEEFNHYGELLAREGIPVRVAGKSFNPKFKSAIKALPGGVEFLKAIPEEFCPWAIDILGELLCDPPDIFHAWLDHSNIWGGVAALLANTPLIVLSTRNVNPMHFPYLASPYFLSMYKRMADSQQIRFINNSHAGAESYAKWLGLPLERISVVLNGVDFADVRRADPEIIREFKREVSLPDRCRIIAGVFRLSDEKQPLVFLEVVRRVLSRLPDVYIVIAGIGPLEAELREFITLHGMRERVYLLGRRSDVPTVLSAADLLLLTSRQEGTPNVLLEAQWLQCPVVSTRAGGAVDAVAHGESGFLVDVGDVDGIESAVMNILSDDKLAGKMSQAGPEFIKKKFSVDRMVQETISVYDLAQV